MDPVAPGYAWICLLIAGALEIVWALAMKHAHGFTKLWPSVFVLSVMAVSFYFLSQSLKSIPVGTAYAVWTGIGAAGAAVFGMILYHEPATAGRLASVVLVVAGIVGLKIFS